MSNINKNFFSVIEKDWVSQSGLSVEGFKKEVSFALQHIDKNPYLLKCTQKSILKAVMNVAQIELTLNPVLKYCYLVPRKVNGVLECVLDPSYIGLQKLLTDAGVVKSINCHVIHQGDDIEVDMSDVDNPIKRHIPHFLTGNEKGEIIGGYSLAILTDSKHIEMMSRKDIEEIRDKSEGYKAYKSGRAKSAIWVTHESEMCRKTIVKRHYKYLPKSGKTEAISRAIELDNYAAGYDEQIDYSYINYLEGLIDSSTLTTKLKERYMDDLVTLEFLSQGKKMAKELQKSQPIMGLESTPKRKYEVVQAVGNKIDVEDFKERNKNK